MINVLKIINTLIVSYRLDEYLEFNIEESFENVNLFTEDDFEQKCYVVTATHKIFTSLPKDINKEWTLETYQKELVNTIPLNDYCSIVFWSDDGIIAVNPISKDVQLKITWEMISLLTNLNQ